MKKNKSRSHLGYISISMIFGLVMSVFILGFLAYKEKAGEPDTTISERDNVYRYEEINDTRV